MALPTYCYQPLTPNAPAIRLLEVLSLESSEVLCQLKEVSLDQDPVFTALSYHWGTPEGTIPAVLYEKGKRTQLLITPNLQSFLRQYIHDYPDLRTRSLLWVDAVCINQKDIRERGSQVRLMHDIYQKAQHVVVWLGQGTPQSNIGMDFVAQLVAAEQREKKLGGEVDATAVARYRLSQLGLPKESEEDDEYTAFVSLFYKEWFSRVWVIQEVAMGKEVRLTCGSRFVSWDDFVRAFYLFNSLNLIIPDPSRKNQAVFRMVGIIDARESRKLGYKRDLLGTLLRCRSSFARDAKDKVFALLGLATNIGPNALDLRANYGLKTQDVYAGLAFAIIEFEQNLDILGVPRATASSSEWEPNSFGVLSDNTSNSQHASKSPMSQPAMEILSASLLPSWVPNWSAWDSTLTLNRRDRPASYLVENEVLLRNAAGGTRAMPRISSDKSMLGLQGHVFDQVTKVGTIYESEDRLIDSDRWWIEGTKFYKGNMHTLLQWESISQARTGKLYRPTGEPMLAAYWQTITAGWQIDEYKLSSSTYLQWDSYHRPGAVLRRLVGPWIATSSSYAWFTFGLMFCKQMIRPPPELGFDRPLSLASNRRFMRSKKGFMGLVPADTRVGDTIALFKGGGSPLIIRSRGENWELVGDSYVHGMMNGECFCEERCQTMWLV